jgi:hypothetical protein
MARFSKRPHCRAWVFAINLGILGNLALVLRQAPKTSLSSTSRDLIISQSTTVNAGTSLCPVGFNYYDRDGFQRRFPVHKQFSPSIALKCFMNSHYKGKPTCMTTIILSSDDPTTPTYPLQLYVKLPSFFVTHSDFSLVSIFRDSPRISNVEEFDDPQTIWSWSRSSRSCWDISRRVDG